MGATRIFIRDVLKFTDFELLTGGATIPVYQYADENGRRSAILCGYIDPLLDNSHPDTGIFNTYAELDYEIYSQYGVVYNYNCAVDGYYVNNW